jgi:hypothetical protein
MTDGTETHPAIHTGSVAQSLARTTTTPGHQGAEHATPDRRQKAMDVSARRHLRALEAQWKQYED